MKRFVMVFALLIMSCVFSSRAMALTGMTDNEPEGVTAQSGISGVTDTDRHTVGITGTLLDLVSLNHTGDTLETKINIKDAVIDIDHIEMDLLKTDDFSLGHFTLEVIPHGHCRCNHFYYSPLIPVYSLPQHWDKPIRSSAVLSIVLFLPFIGVFYR